MSILSWYSEYTTPVFSNNFETSFRHLPNFPTNCNFQPQEILNSDLICHDSFLVSSVRMSTNDDVIRHHPITFSSIMRSSGRLRTHTVVRWKPRSVIKMKLSNQNRKPGVFCKLSFSHQIPVTSCIAATLCL